MGAPMTPEPHPLSCHPHPESPHPLQSSRLYSAAEVVPILQVGVPPDVTEFENCTNTESFV